MDVNGSADEPHATAWATTTLGDLVSLQRGHDLPDAVRRDGQVPVMSAAGHSGFHDQAIARGPGVVIGRSGASIGEVHYCVSDFWPHNTALYVTDFQGNEPLFAFYFLQSLHLSRHNSGGAQPSLNRNFVYPISVATPPRAEQRAIAEALSDVDGLLGALEGLIAKKRATKQAAMQQLLTGKTRLPGFSGEWETKPFGELGQFLKGSGVKRDDARSGPLACVRYGEIYTAHNDYIRTFCSRISPEVAATATRLQFGDLLFAGSGETKEEIGKSVAFVSRTEAYAGGDIVILRSEGVNPLFLGYASNVPYVARQKASFGQGDAVVHISAKALAQVSLALPQIEEQAAIAIVLSDIDAEIAALEARRDKTCAIKQGMMQQLLTGRVRLVEPAEAV